MYNFLNSIKKIILMIFFIAPKNKLKGKYNEILNDETKAFAIFKNIMYSIFFTFIFLKMWNFFYLNKYISFFVCNKSFVLTIFICLLFRKIIINELINTIFTQDVIKIVEKIIEFLKYFVSKK